MRFCPLLSTAEKKVECQPDCAWAITKQNGDHECQINYISDCLDSIDRSSGIAASGIANKFL